MKLKKILCVGDLILDSYSDGLVHRVSPEAPIPVLKVLKKINLLWVVVGTWQKI